MPVITSGVRVGVRVTRRNRQHLNGRNTRVWRLHNPVDKKIVEFGYIVTVRAFYFDLAAKMVVVRKGVGPDDAEMTFASGAHERVVAWHWRTPAKWNELQVGERGMQFTFSGPRVSIGSFTVPGQHSAFVWPGKRVTELTEKMDCDPASLG